MVFFIVAASLPSKNEKDSMAAVESCTMVNGRPGANIHLIKDSFEKGVPGQVEKAKFKIGTLDSLMELNEALVKVDQTLESTVKKMEKVVFEIDALYKSSGVKPDGDATIFVEIPAKDQPNGRVKEDPLKYIQNFKWESIKYSQGRSLPEIAGIITDKMKATDNDIKKVQDELTETRNQLNAIQKKEGDNYANFDVSDRIYKCEEIKRAEDYFVEKYKQTEMFADVIVIVNKTKVEVFKNTYEKIIPWTENSFGAVPRSAKQLPIKEDKFGNQIWRIVVIKDKLNEYLNEGRKAGFILRPFTYNYDKYKQELEESTKLEDKVGLLTHTLYKKAQYAFSELFIALMHLKVMRAFIDGVLRFGIPPRFALAVVHPQKGMEKQVLANLNQRFNDSSLAGLYGSGSGGKDDGDDDFFSFVNIPLTSPMFLM